ncbi:hypothetical protein [Tautonia marina]|uniref:hypothetical protein n=1 Tax=Tautonia marina TaxID=2653855 RepID=UPI001260508F|nr:hypothetical protein [Tautonia marina]
MDDNELPDIAREEWSLATEPDMYLINGVISVPRCYEDAERDAHAINALPKLIAACVAITEAGDDLRLREAFEAATEALKAARLR